MPNINLVLAKLRQALECKNDVQLADELGISPSTISTWKKRLTIPYDKIEEVSAKTNISFIWFVTDNDEMTPEAPVLAPVMERITTNFPKDVGKDDFSGYFTVPGAPQGSYVIKAPDEGMAPAVRQGDFLLFIPGNDFTNGDFLVVLDEWGKTLVRQCREKDGNHFLVADNPEHPALSLGENLKVVGKVIDFWRRILA